MSIQTFRGSGPTALLTSALIMVLLSIPLALLVFAIIQSWRGQNDSGTIMGLLLDLTIVYPALAISGVLGAFLFAGLIQVTSARSRVHRWHAVALVPIAALPWGLLSLRALVFSWPMILGILIGLLGLALLMPLPRGE